MSEMGEVDMAGHTAETMANWDHPPRPRILSPTKPLARK